MRTIMCNEVITEGGYTWVCIADHRYGVVHNWMREDQSQHLVWNDATVRFHNAYVLGILAGISLAGMAVLGIIILYAYFFGGPA